MPAISRILVLLFLFTVPNVRAQWQNVMPNLLGNFSLRNWAEGAMTFADGKLWIGRTGSLWTSADTGTTWTQTTTGFQGRIRDIAAYDRSTCMFSTDRGEVYITRDGGGSWQLLVSVFGAARAISFFDSPKHIVVFEGTYAHLTHDGGATWTPKLISTEVLDCKWLGGGVLYFSAGNVATLEASIWISTDYGETWRTTSGKYDNDSYSFEVGACDRQTIVVVNEDYLTPADALSSIFRSTDNGTTWQAIESRDRTINFFCGSISGTRLAMFAQTHLSGVMRSLDQGATWKSIGGPNGDFDTRLVTAINSNIIFAVDQSDGSVWRTMNSGNDSLDDNGLEPIPITVSATLFDNDSVDRCDSSIESIIVVRHRECVPLSVATERLAGNATQDYLLLTPLPTQLTGNDTIRIRFDPTTAGLRQAVYELTLSDGRVLRTDLLGTGIGLDTILFNPQTALAFDTLSACDDSLLKTIFISYIGCSETKKVDEQIVGSQDFTIVAHAPDSLGTNDFVRISFKPSSDGPKNATYVLTLTSGRTITVPLTGFGLGAEQPSLSTRDQEFDTLGATVFVPIMIDSLDKQLMAELVVHYDSKLEYLGSKTANGTVVDIPGQQFPGRSKIRIPASDVRLIGSSAYASFNFIADSVFTPKVWFDSLNLIGNTLSCSSSSIAVSEIHLPPGCDYLMIANFFYHNTPPSFSISPNPTSGLLTITADRSLGDANIQLFDALGMLLDKRQVSLTKGRPLHIELPAHAGGYQQIVISTPFGSWSRAIIVQK